ncbi:MAG: acyl-CoA thioesterase [Planctomycetes bacterium]|nr:acyl-CoA thioesterase [Planctomycetota bacterium]
MRSYELDSLGHLNNAVWFSWLEQATFAALGRKGIPFESFADRGWIPVVVHASLDFRQELRAGDEALVEGRVLGFGRTSVRLGYRITRLRDDSVAATGERVWVILGDAREKIPVPKELVDALT